MARIEFPDHIKEPAFCVKEFKVPQPKIVSTAEIADIAARHEDHQIYIQHWRDGDEWPVLKAISLVRVEDGKIILSEGNTLFHSMSNGWEKI